MIRGEQTKANKAQTKNEHHISCNLLELSLTCNGAFLSTTTGKAQIDLGQNGSCLHWGIGKNGYSCSSVQVKLSLQLFCGGVHCHESNFSVIVWRSLKWLHKCMFPISFIIHATLHMHCAWFATYVDGLCDSCFWVAFFFCVILLACHVGCRRSPFSQRSELKDGLPNFSWFEFHRTSRPSFCTLDTDVIGASYPQSDASLITDISNSMTALHWSSSSSSTHERFCLSYDIGFIRFV